MNAPRRKADALLWAQYRSAALQLTREAAEEALALIETHQDAAGLEAAASRKRSRKKKWAQLAEGVACVRGRRR